MAASFAFICIATTPMSSGKWEGLGNSVLFLVEELRVDSELRAEPLKKAGVWHQGTECGRWPSSCGLAQGAQCKSLGLVWNKCRPQGTPAWGAGCH